MSCPSTVFKTDAFVHSATLPASIYLRKRLEHRSVGPISADLLPGETGPVALDLPASRADILYYGDNLDILRDHVPTESVDLTGRRYGRLRKSRTNAVRSSTEPRGTGTRV